MKKREHGMQIINRLRKQKKTLKHLYNDNAEYILLYNQKIFSRIM